MWPNAISRQKQLVFYHPASVKQNIRAQCRKYLYVYFVAWGVRATDRHSMFVYGTVLLPASSQGSAKPRSCKLTWYLFIFIIYLASKAYNALVHYPARHSIDIQCTCCVGVSVKVEFRSLGSHFYTTQCRKFVFTARIQCMVIWFCWLKKLVDVLFLVTLCTELEYWNVTLGIVF